MTVPKIEGATYWSRLEPALRRLNFTKATFAAALGISIPALHKIVRQGGALNAKNNQKAAELLGLNPGWLATGKGTPEAVAAAAAVLQPRDAALLLWTAAHTHTPARRKAVLAYFDELMAAPDEAQAQHLAGLIDAALAHPAATSPS